MSAVLEMPALEDALLREVMDALARNALPLPSLPEVAINVGRISVDPRSTAARVAAEVNKDPATAVRLLRVANSAAYRGSGLVTSVEQAITRLGLSAVRQLVYALSLENVFISGFPVLDACLRQTWMGSVEVAAISHLLAERTGKVPAEDALLAGLIHQIGVLPIIQLAQAHAELRESAGALARVLDRAAAAAGEAVLYRWSFPMAVVQVPRGCIDFARAHRGPPDLLDIVSVACLLADPPEQRRYGSVDRSRVAAFTALGLDAGFNWRKDVEFRDEVKKRLGWLRG